MKTVILWLGFLGCLLAGMLQSDISIGVVLQPVAAVMVLLPVALYLLVIQGASVTAFVDRVAANRCTADDRHCLDTAASLGFLFGVVGMIVGFIKVMANLSNTAGLGAGIAVSVISALYGAIPAILLLPCYPKTDNPPKTAGKAAGYLMICLAVACGGNLMTVLYCLKA